MSKTPDEFNYMQRDKYYWDSLDRLFKENNFSSEAILRNWPAYVMRRDIPRFLAHYELFKGIIDLPGHIVELGVFRGASLCTWTSLLETFCASDRYRKVFGFDHFGGLRKEDFAEQDGKDDTSAGKCESGYKATAEEVRTLVEIHNFDNLMPGNERCNLVEGDVFETLPQFIEDNPGLKISLLHLDMDLYKATKFALELLYPLVATGGVICFDEYGLIPWQGETQAVDDYFADFTEPPAINKFNFHHSPGGYVIKK